MENIVIRKITCDEVESAMSLALEVFMQFEAPDYDPFGVESFKRDIVENPEYLENARKGVCPIYGAFDGHTIVALMGMRSSKTHINLVFTKKEYHRKGIARAIFHYLLSDLLAENPTLDALTLNSSPYGLPFYLALGFVPQSEEQEINGIRFTPMKYIINKQRRMRPMIILIAGASHTGKTVLAQRLLEKYHYPYLSIDHLKMGLIRSGQTTLTPMDDDQLTDYLWPIVREMIKTAIENKQNLIVEGCYIPFEWEKDFAPEYRKHIHYRCLIMSRNYIESHFDDIQSHGSAIEQRLDDSSLCKETLIHENDKNLMLCQKYGCDYILLDDSYDIKLTDVMRKP